MWKKTLRLLKEIIGLRLMVQRNSIEAASSFVCRNRLPPRLKQQILAYMCLRFKAESLNQHQLIEQLPKSICKSICQHLFLPTVKKVYLFKGISREILLLLVCFDAPFLHTPNESGEILSSFEDFQEKLSLSLLGQFERLCFLVEGSSSFPALILKHFLFCPPGNTQVFTFSWKKISPKLNWHAYLMVNILEKEKREVPNLKPKRS